MNYLNNTCNNHFNDRILCDCLVGSVEQATLIILGGPLSTLIHELGHFIAIKLLIKQANPIIQLDSFGFGEGRVLCYQHDLSETGEWLGSYNAKAIIAAAGPIAEITASLALLKLFPGNGVSLIGLTENAHYAVTALFKKSFYKKAFLYSNVELHDFVSIKKFKPFLWAETLIIISVALGIFATYSFFTNLAGPLISALHDC